MNIVEFGPGYTPAFRYSEHVEDRLDAGANYIGIDVSRSDIKEIKRREGVSLVVGDLGKIPLKANTADELWLLNVFSGRLINNPTILPDGRSITVLSVRRFFEEMVRVLKPNGNIIIGEWAPRIGKIDWIKDYDYEQYGLSKQVYERETLQDFANLQGIRFGIIRNDTPPFFVVLSKTS